MSSTTDSTVTPSAHLRESTAYHEIDGKQPQTQFQMIDLLRQTGRDEPDADASNDDSYYERDKELIHSQDSALPI